MTSTNSKRLKGIKALSVIAVLFGILTLISGSSTLFVDGAARAAAGNYVGFVLWFNFLAGFSYILAGVGLYQLRRWATVLAAIIAGATLLVFAAFGIHILLDGSFEPRTVGAMILRSGFWVITAIAARFAMQTRTK